MKINQDGTFQMRHIKITLNVNGLKALQLNGSNFQTGCAHTSINKIQLYAI